MADIFIELKAKNYQQLCEELGFPEGETWKQYPELGLEITAEERTVIRGADFGSIVTLICSVIGGVANIATCATWLYTKLKKSSVADEVEIVTCRKVTLTEEILVDVLKKAKESDQVRLINTPPPANPTISEQIQQLAVLHATGALTDEEFAAKKAELLARM